MVSLDVEKINANSPYYVEEVAGAYLFETDHGVQYGIYFTIEDVLKSTEAYQLFIVNLNGKKSPRDNKLRLTIMAIIAEFFECNNVTILYICDTSDGKQQMRSRLFHAWFNSYEKHYKFFFYTAPIQDEDVTNYATIFFRMDNPKATEIIAEFTETVQMLNIKPSEE